MEKVNTKSNIFLALFLSFLTAIAGALVFGFIYAIGYYVYFLAIGEIILACVVFLKFCQKPNWKTITFAIIWSLAWTFLFNVLAIVVCESYFVASEYNVSFQDSLNTIIKAWKTDAEIKSYMNTRVGQVAGMIALGGFVYGIYFISQIKRNKKTQTANQINLQNANVNIVSNPTKNSFELPKTKESPAIQTYNTVMNELKKSIAKFAQDKNQEALKLQIMNVKQKLIAPLATNEKQEIVLHTLEQQQKKNTPIEKRAMTTLLKMLII